MLDLFQKNIETQLNYMKMEIKQSVQKTLDLKAQNKKALDEIKKVYTDNGKVRMKMTG